MTKREKTKSSIGALNSLNEEDDETTQYKQKLDDSFLNNKSSDTSEEFDRSVEQHKLRLAIEGVFKPAAACEIDTNLDENKQRLDSLIHLLIDRLVTSHDLNEPAKPKLQFFNKLSSSAAYSTYLSVSFSQNNKNEIITESDVSILDLNNLNLTNECLKEFSSVKITKDDLNEKMNLKKNSEEILAVNLSRNRLSSLPINLIGMFSNLEIINLSENNFDGVILANLSIFVNLKEINLRSNILKSIKLYNDEQEEQEENKQDTDQMSTNVLFTVERLNLANNKLNSSTCLLVAQFRNLKYLNVSNNDFQLNGTAIELQLPWQKSNSHLKNLIELNFSKNNKTTAIRKPDSKLLSASKTMTIPFFDALTNLRVLDLTENNLYNMPNDIKELRHLEVLILDFNFLEFLPNELTELRKLKTLSASSNRISELSLNFCSFARFRDSITRINLSKNQLRDETFTYKMAIFENLKELDLSYNLFELVPSPLPLNLEELNLNNNKIKSLMIRPLSQIALNDDDVMQLLDIEDKKFRQKIAQKPTYTENEEKDNLQVKPKQNSAKRTKKSFDERIYDEPDVDKLDTIELPHVFYLRNLRRLHLRDNHLSEIPPDFGILNSNLEFIDLGFNLLHELDVSLCRGLAYLKYLDLTSNRIKHLPDKLRELNDLEYLDLSKNRIRMLSSELCNDLKNLKELNLSNNSLDHLFLINNALSQKSSLSTSRHTSMSSGSGLKNREYSKFTFNLPNLKKLNLSNNRLNSSLSLYRSFGLSSQLTEIDLSLNQLTTIEVDYIEEKESITMALNQECIFDEEKIKKMSVPKHRLYELTTLNLSHNQIEIQNKGGFTKILCNLYKLAPNLSTFIYDQKSGIKLGSFQPEVTQMPPKISIADSLQQVPIYQADDDDDFCFELNEDDYFILNETEAFTDKIQLFEFLNSKIRREFFDLMRENLKSIDLSNNSLKKIPTFFYKLKNIKEIYFNGNLLKKIPNEMFKHIPLNNADDEEFENLKKIQKKAELLKKKAEEAAAAAEEDDEQFDQEKIEEEVKVVEKKKKKKKKKDAQEPPQIEPMINDKSALNVPVLKQPEPLISDQLEILHLNSNQIEYVPNNLFAHFKILREIKLNDNPLNNPPQHSVCVSAKLQTRNQAFFKQQIKTDSVNIVNESSTISLLASNFMRSSSEIGMANKNFISNNIATRSSSALTDKKLNLPNLFFETTENLKPLQSYMFNHKKREDMLLCNMFLIVKDNIDSLETLMKLLRRLKMPMDRCEYVCTEIHNSVAKNWNKIASIEYPPEPGKLSMSRKELNKKMHQYILKLQAWNLLNAWRNTFGADAHSDELLRILKLMNSNNYENDLFEKLYKLKYKSNAFRV